MDIIISHGTVTLFNEQHEQSWAELCEAMKGVVSRQKSGLRQLYSLWERWVSCPTQRIARSGVITCSIVSNHSVGRNRWRRHCTAEIPTHCTDHIHVLQNTKYQHVFCEVQLDRRNRREIDKKFWLGKMMGRHSLEEICVKSSQRCSCDLRVVSGK